MKDKGVSNEFNNSIGYSGHSGAERVAQIGRQ